LGQGAGGCALCDHGGHGRGGSGRKKNPRHHPPCRHHDAACRARAFLPLEQTPANLALFEHYVACAADLGLTIGGEYTGGSADSGYTSAIGAPTLCGTGPIGAKAHTPDEFCDLDSMPMRAKALALAIMRIESGD
jgi:acetylornithine deacetylase/succinyl-diaminopimelate desuccinylase-like protein